MKAYAEYVVHDVLGHLEGVTARPMFGGYGLYLNGQIFGIITEPDEVRFKVGERNREQYEALGSTPFVYTGHKNKKPVTMQYYLVPEEVQEDRERIARWVHQSAQLSTKRQKAV